MADSLYHSCHAWAKCMPYMMQMPGRLMQVTSAACRPYSAEAYTPSSSGVILSSLPLLYWSSCLHQFASTPSPEPWRMYVSRHPDFLCKYHHFHLIRSDLDNSMSSRQRTTSRLTCRKAVLILHALMHVSMIGHGGAERPLLSCSMHGTYRLACLQVIRYICTLICHRVETLEHCLAMIEPAFRGVKMPSAEENARSVKHGILAALRQWLYLRALGRDAPLPDSCPALDAEACFDAGCPIATRVGLLKVRIPHLHGHG